MLQLENQQGNTQQHLLSRIPPGSGSTGLFAEAYSSPKEEENIVNLTGFHEKRHEHPSNELKKLLKGSIRGHRWI